MNLEECKKVYMNHNFLFFWGQKNEGGREVFSQWHPSDFHFNGMHFKYAEHYMMYRKALLFNDFDSINKILHAHSPKEAKVLGKNVANFDQAIWDFNKKDIVFYGNLLKFSQNKSLKDYIISTGDDILVEASPYDKIWGIGLSADDERAKNPNTWQGENLLGFALMKVRSFLKLG